MNDKIQDRHKNKLAYIYIRQSTMGQIYHNQESTERQYRLKEKALQLGWTLPMIKILDQDLGVSGSQMSGREDFKTLVADVSMGKVGAVLALEASRLARSCADWHRLLELCSITGTLIIDEDGCYNLSDFNDQLVLGLKGTMSQAELHILRARLLGGKQNKAKKGELRFPLPVGYCYNEQGNIEFDPDKEVYGCVCLLFKIFHQKGSAYGVVHEFARLGMKFPKRQYGGAWSGQLIWGQLSHNRVLTILKNPCYSGVYTYGKSGREKVISPDGGDIIFRVKNLPISLWQVIIKDHHPSYISWEEFLENQKKLKSNQTNGEENILSGAAREGLALLQGLVICGQCGRKLNVRYKGNNGIYPTYQCNRLKGEGLSKSYCMSVRCDLLDDAVSNRILEILKEDQVTIALKAVEELERRDKSIDKQWQMRIERAEYEAHLSQRRYEQVDPSNRLVASTLEKNWNDALIKLQELDEEFTKHKKKHGLCITPEEKERLFALVQDFPRLWKSPTTQSKDKKRMLRLFIKDITVERRPDERKAILHLRWQGGASEDIAITLPQKIYERQRYSTEIVEMVRNLAKEKMDSEIANYLNEQGYESATSKSFTPAMIKWIRYKYKISSAQLKQPGELTVDEISKKIGVKRSMVYYWIERGIISGRRLNKGSPYWITITPEKERELDRWCKKSKKIQTKNFTNFKKPIAGGAV